MENLITDFALSLHCSAGGLFHFKKVCAFIKDLLAYSSSEHYPLWHPYCFHLRLSHCHHVGIIDSKELEGTKVQWFPVCKHVVIIRAVSSIHYVRNKFH
jgi:hypothetical protein